MAFIITNIALFPNNIELSITTAITFTTILMIILKRAIPTATGIAAPMVTTVAAVGFVLLTRNYGLRIVTL